MVRRHQQHAGLLLRQGLDLLQKRRNRTVKAQGGTGGESDLVHGVDVIVQNIHGAQLIHLQAGQRRDFGQQFVRRKIDVGRGDERTDAAALMPLLDFVPPAVRLVADHGRLFLKDMHLGKQVEEGAIGARHRAEKLPSGKDAYAAGDQRPVQQFRVVSGIETASAQALVHRGQQIL